MAIHEDADLDALVEAGLLTGYEYSSDGPNARWGGEELRLSFPGGAVLKIEALACEGHPTPTACFGIDLVEPPRAPLPAKDHGPP